MKKTLTLKWLAVVLLAALVLTGCTPAPGYTDTMSYTAPKVISTVSVTNGAEEEQPYAQNENFTLYVNEKLGTFAVVDTNGNRWDSVPNINPEDYAGKDLALSNLCSLIQIHYCDLLNNTSQARSYGDSVAKGTAQIQKIENGVRFVFTFDGSGFEIPVQVLLRKDGVDVSLINAEIKETNSNFVLTSVDVAPYFNAPHIDDDGYIVVPDGSGALIDWKTAADSGVKYRQFVYGRDSAIVVSERNASAQNIRLPMFGNQFTAAVAEPAEPDAEVTPVALTETAGCNGFTAIITEGSARSAINASVGTKSSPYSSVFAEFIYRETALVKIEKKAQTVRMVEQSHTTIPVQTVRLVLMNNAESLNYVDMAGIYRDYLLNELDIAPTTQAQSAPLVIELFGGVMKQQFVMGFPVDKVVALTSFDDAKTIVSKLKAAGVDQVIINYTEWQKDATGAAIQDKIKPENNLGGAKELKELIALCKSEGVSIYLDTNVSRMIDSAMGYNTTYDSASSLRRDPAVQYYYKPNTGIADILNPSFMLTPSKMLQVAQKLATGIQKYDITGMSSSILGQSLYSDFSKYPTTRDHSLYYWNDAMTAMASAEGSLLLSGGNAYSLGYATFITDTPMDYSGYLLESTAIPLYQIALHGIVDMSVSAINEASDIRSAFLYAVETGSSLKWNWTAQNQDELVETNFNYLTSTDYENWLDLAVQQYKEAAGVLKAVSNCTIVEHQQLSSDLVRVVWSNGTTVLVNYGAEAAVVDGIEVGAQSFVARGGAA